MRKTLVRSSGTNWSGSIMRRLENASSSTEGLAIVNHLVRNTNGYWEATQIADKALDILAAASDLSESDEYGQLRTALAERGRLTD